MEDKGLFISCSMVDIIVADDLVTQGVGQSPRHQTITWTNSVLTSHYTEVLWVSPESNFLASGQAYFLHDEFENYISQEANELTHWGWVTFASVR